MMRRLSLHILLALLFLCVPVQVLAAAIPRLDAPPEGERWFGIVMGGDRVGFAHQTITRVGDGYRIHAEGSVKMRVMGFSREATSRETYLVGSDLSLKSFSTESRIDGNPMAARGEATPKGFKVTVESGGTSKERLLKSKGAVYPPPALNIYPLMRGTVAGKSYKVPMLDPESVKVKQIKVEVVGEETLPPATEAVHLRNNLYPMVSNDIWVDLKGNTIKESVRDDLVVTQAEDEATAKLHLAEDALAKKDVVLDFSLIPVTPPIEHPEQVKKLSVELTGIPAPMPLLQGKSQQATRLPDGKVVFTMPNPAYAPVTAEVPAAADRQPATQPQSDAPEIVAKKSEILGNEQSPGKQAKLLAEWVSKGVKLTVAESQTAVDTLKKGEGNCQGHARLYASLARAAGIPTRIVSGLVYSSGQGFLYHCWAESFLDGDWVPVDPTLGEMPADPTHVKLVLGDAPEDLELLAGVIGKVQAKVLEKGY